MPWAIKWRSENRLDGKREYLMGRFHARDSIVPGFMRGHRTMVFETRAEARAYMRKHWGYIANRQDLRREPHGWKSPIPVKVKVMVKEIR